jgi:integrase
MTQVPAPSPQRPKLLESFRDELRVRRYAPRTGKTYESWIRRFIRFHHLRHPREMGTVEIHQFLTHLAVVVWLIYGTGLRIEEAMMLRVKDLDFERREVIVRAGKGNKDRRTVLPGRLVEPLQQHLKMVKSIHAKDLSEGWGKVLLPDALARKYASAPQEWVWQWWRLTMTYAQSRNCWATPTSGQQ